ncbi:maleylacetoacetate isomerase [Sphingobium sp. CR28]|uniref:maleylacetoacetate isomerase n=1 Tax=Sphingobium sp. CR28 TaxID=3400272 RepID=UPI003FEE4001
MTMTLHGYWRSSASYRVRIGANLKGIDYSQSSYDLRKGEQSGPALGRHAPLGLVPALEVDGESLSQSLAILEWLEESYPTQPLLPADAMSRGIVRAMASTIACDIHPLNNLRVLQALRHDLGVPEDAVKRWIERWIHAGFAALEIMIRDHGKGFCFGETPTIADCCLVPQIYNARRFHVDLTDFPELLAVDARCSEIDAFARAAPERQPDADGAGA